MADAQPSDLVRRPYDRGVAIASVAIAGGWHVFHNLLAMLGAWSGYRWPAVVGIAWVVYAVGIVVAGRADVAGRAVRRPWVWCAVVLLVTVVVGVAAPDPLTPANWAWGAAGWIAILLLWRRPLPELLAFLALNTVASLGVQLADGGGDRVALARWLAVICGTATLQIALAGFVRALRVASGWAASAAAGRAETVAAGQAAEEVHKTRLERYGAFQRDTATLLGDLAAGRADPGSPPVRHLAAIQAARLRRLLVERGDTPNPLVDELRACGDVAERTGVVVELSTVGTVPPLPVLVRRALAEPAIAALSGARSHARVTISALPAEIAVSVVADVRADVGADVGAGEPAGGGPAGAVADPAASSPAADAGGRPDAGVVVQWYRTGEQIWVEARAAQIQAPDQAHIGQTG